MFELVIRLPARGSRQMLGALHGQLRAAIRDGRLKPGSPLPPTRTLAAQLGLARNTVIAAYDRLLAEGYLIARRGAGTRVAALPTMAGPAAAVAPADDDVRLSTPWRAAAAIIPPVAVVAPLRYDFGLGAPDTSRFPLAIWQRLQTRALRALAKAPAEYGLPAGPAELRAAIAGHVAFARAVSCGADDILVTAGAQQGFDLLARVLVTAGRTRVAVEDPGYPPARAAFAAAGAEIVPIPIDAEGLIVERLPRDIGVIVVTPSHQFPVGVAMSPRRRAELLAFAAARDAVIVEDDYDGEFRFGGRPVEALQTLDRAGAVIYVGTFSKSLFPALRLGYLVAPAWVRGALIQAKRITDGFPPAVAAATLAAFIAEGHLAKHIRAMRRIYAERRAALGEALARHCAESLAPIASVAGLHVSVRFRRSIESGPLVAALGAVGLGVERIERYRIDDQTWSGLALGIGAIRTAEIEPAIRLLSDVLDNRR